MTDHRDLYFECAAKNRLSGTFLRLAWLMTALCTLGLVASLGALVFALVRLVLMIFWLILILLSLFLLLASPEFRHAFDGSEETDRQMIGLLREFLGVYIYVIAAAAVLAVLFGALALVFSERNPNTILRGRRKGSAIAMFVVLAITVTLTVVLCARSGVIG